MSNVQVHCEHCDKSLYVLEANSFTTAPSVVLFTERDLVGRDRVWDPNRHDFCGWGCASGWALSRGLDE